MTAKENLREFQEKYICHGDGDGIMNLFMPDMILLLKQIEDVLYTLAKTPMSRDQAIHIRQRFALPLGVLVKNHNLDLKADRRQHYKSLIDNRL